MMIDAAPPSCEIATMAGYAAWPEGQTPQVSVALAAEGRLTFGGHPVLTATVSSVGGDVTISRFLGPTRGLAFEVENAEGKRVCPAEEPPWSPPPPPPSDEATVLVAPSTPFRFNLDEPGKWIFPGPGDYKIRAVLVLWGAGAERRGPNYNAVSPAVAVHVNP